jgi:hypothetical protein
MEDKHFLTEVYRVGLERFFRIMTQDNLLTNFAKGFKGPRDETGLLDAGPPKWWTDQYMALEKKAQKTAGIANIEGYSCQFDSETGNLTIQSPMPNVQLSPAGQLELIAFIMRGAPPELVQAQATPGGNVGGGQNAYEFSPELKLRHEQNLQALEQFAKASSKGFPK